MDRMGLGRLPGRGMCVCKPLSSCAEETGHSELSEGPGSRGERKQTAPGEGAPPTRLSSRLGKVWWRCGSQLRTSLIPFNLHEALRV